MNSHAPAIDRWTGDLEAIFGLQPAEEADAGAHLGRTTSRRLAWATSICVAVAGIGVAVVAVRSDHPGAWVDDVRRLVEPATAIAPQAPAARVDAGGEASHPVPAGPVDAGLTSNDVVTTDDADVRIAPPATHDRRSASPAAAPVLRVSRPPVARRPATAGPDSRRAPAPDVTQRPDSAPAVPRAARDARPSAALTPEIVSPPALGPVSPPGPVMPGALQDRPGSVDEQATPQPTAGRQKPTKTEAIDAMRMLRRQ